MKPNHFLILAIVIVVATLILVNWKQLKAAVQAKTGGTSTGGSPVTGAPGSAQVGATTSGSGSVLLPPSINYDKVLKRGVSGAEVQQLQQMLNRVNAVMRKISVQLVEDSAFGAKTETMLKAYNDGVGQTTLNQAFIKYQQAIGLK